VATVLVCEDDEDIRALVVAVLASRRFGVVEAADVAGGLAAVAAGGVDTVVTDVALPDGSGVDVCRAASDAGARVVVMTAAAGPELPPDVATCAARVLRKPFALAQLLDAVDDGQASP
jgi:two-component system OmpR family response regulator